MSFKKPIINKKNIIFLILHSFIVFVTIVVFNISSFFAVDLTNRYFYIKDNNCYSINSSYSQIKEINNNLNDSQYCLYDKPLYNINNKSFPVLITTSSVLQYGVPFYLDISYTISPSYEKIFMPINDLDVKKGNYFYLVENDVDKYSSLIFDIEFNNKEVIDFYFGGTYKTEVINHPYSAYFQNYILIISEDYFKSEGNINCNMFVVENESVLNEITEKTGTKFSYQLGNNIKEEYKKFVKGDILTFQIYSIFPFVFSFISVLVLYLYLTTERKKDITHKSLFGASFFTLFKEVFFEILILFTLANFFGVLGGNIVSFIFNRSYLLFRIFIVYFFINILVAFITALFIVKKYISSNVNNVL